MKKEEKSHSIIILHHSRDSEWIGFARSYFENQEFTVTLLDDNWKGEDEFDPDSIKGIFIMLSPAFVDDKWSQEIITVISRQAAKKPNSVRAVELKPCDWEKLPWSDYFILASSEKGGLTTLDPKSLQEFFGKLMEDIDRPERRETRESFRRFSDFSCSDTVSEIVDLAYPGSAYSDDLTSSSILFGFISWGENYRVKWKTPAFLFDFLSANKVDLGIYYAFYAFENKKQKKSDKARSAKAPEKADERKENVPESMTTNVLGILKEAERISVKTTGTNRISARHLLTGILLYEPETGQTGAQKRFEEMGVDMKSFRREFFDFISALENSDDKKAWEEIIFNIEGRDYLIPLYDSDAAEGEDLLGIAEDIGPLAKLIASKYSIPPLSIGLFGDWGSGKSFFMRKLKSQVEFISRRVRNSGIMQKDAAFYKHIVQIEFNAWHYSSGNLWASLMDHIWKNLGKPDKEDTELDKIRKHWIEKVAESKVDLERISKRKKVAKDKLEEAEKRLEELKNSREEKVQEFAEISAKTLTDFINSGEVPDEVKEEMNRALKDAGLDRRVQRFEDIIKDLKVLRKFGVRLSRCLIPFFEKKSEINKKKVLGYALGSILAGLVFGAIVYVLFSHYQFLSGIVMTLATGLTTVLARLRKESNKMRPFLNALDKYGDKLESSIKDRKEEFQKSKIRLEQELRSFEVEYTVEASREREAKKRVEELEERIVRGDILSEFIHDRASSDDYRKHLGLIALIRKDFKNLSEGIGQANRKLELMKSLEEEKKGESTRINRIVLYIDDLDRCRPERVVEVLQAIHLLLAFPLFVVVVGVDARWISRSLIKCYEELLCDISDEKEHERWFSRLASPLDYLEKIFQISLWLKPLNPLMRQTMIRGLLKESMVQNEIPDSSAGDQLLKPKIGEENTGVNSEGSIEEMPVQQKDEKIVSVETSSDQNFNVNPERLKTTPSEKRFMEKAAPLLGRSPRAVKRFLNLYHLVKAGLTEMEEASFLDDKEEYANFKIVLFLLAVLTGMPQFSGFIFKTIMEMDASKNKHHISGLIQKVDASREAAGDLLETSDWKRLKNWLETENWSELPISSLSEQIPRICRYAFAVEQIEIE